MKAIERNPSGDSSRRGSFDAVNAVLTHATSGAGSANPWSPGAGEAPAKAPAAAQAGAALLTVPPPAIWAAAERTAGAGPAQWPAFRALLQKQSAVTHGSAGSARWPAGQLARRGGGRCNVIIARRCSACSSTGRSRARNEGQDPADPRRPNHRDRESARWTRRRRAYRQSPEEGLSGARGKTIEEQRSRGAGVDGPDEQAARGGEEGPDAKEYVAAERADTVLRST